MRFAVPRCREQQRLLQPVVSLESVGRHPFVRLKLAAGQARGPADEGPATATAAVAQRVAVAAVCSGGDVVLLPAGALVQAAPGGQSAAGAAAARKRPAGAGLRCAKGACAAAGAGAVAGGCV